jgi:plasmid stability protein
LRVAASLDCPLRVAYNWGSEAGISVEEQSIAAEISIKDTPDHLAEALRRRAAERHRSLQEEVLSILRASVGESERLTFSDFVAEARAQGRGTPAEAAAMVREDRDAGHADIVTLDDELGAAPKTNR